MLILLHSVVGYERNVNFLHSVEGYENDVYFVAFCGGL